MSEYSGQRGSTQTKKKFAELSDRQKKRRAEDLSSCEMEQLLFAAVKLAKQSDQSDLYYVLKLLCNDCKTASEIRRLIEAEKLNNK